jgi:RimJ/RimL family protein N-acetyltransferase
VIPEPVRSERLAGTALTEADRPDWRALLLDPRVAATIGGVPPEREVRARFDADLRHWRDHGFGQWTWRTPDGAFAGRGGLRRHRLEGGEEVVELGYSVVAEHWGVGLATEIARASLAFGFAELGLDRIHAFVFDGNVASARVLDKCGFAQVGPITHAGHPCVLHARDRDARPIGEPVLLRSVYGGRVRWTFPHRFTGLDGGRIGLYCPPGTEGRMLHRHRDGRAPVERWVGGDPPARHVWERTHVLRTTDPAAMHSIDLYWDEAWTFLGWYVNLQAPLVPSLLGYDTTDLALDVWIDPDGTWSWKDEHDLAALVDHGVLDPAGAAAVRREGERVIERSPWPTGWESWRPPPEWTPPPLPDRWDRVRRDVPAFAEPPVSRRRE